MKIFSFKNIKPFVFLNNTLGFIYVILLVLLLYLFAYFYRQNDIYVEKLNSQVFELLKQKELTSKILRKDNFEKDFYNNGKNKLSEDLKLSIHSSSLIIKDIKKSEITENLSIQKKVDLVLLDYKHLQNQFRLYFKYVLQIGNSESGLYNKLILASEEFNERLILIDKNEDLILYFSQLQEMQSIFHFSFDKFTYDLLIKKNNRISSIINRQISTQNNYKYLRISDAYKDYETVFNLFAKKKMQIGFSNEVGLVYKINETISIIENRINEISELVFRNKYNNIVISIIVIIILSFLFILSSFLVSRAFYLKQSLFVNHTENLIKNVDNGVLTEKNEFSLPFELQNIIDSLYRFSEKLMKTEKILLALPDRKINIEITDPDRINFLNDSLLKIWKNFELNDNDLETEKQARFVSDWVKTGLEKFTSILRKELVDVNILSKELLNNLVDYLNIAVGAIYLRKDNEEFFILELVSSFAFGKEKQIKKDIYAGEGIIGTAAVEKKILNITNVPANYFKVSSGFGNTMPRNVLIIPIKFEDEVLGIIELASIKIIKKYELEFIEELGKAFAATLLANKSHKNIQAQYNLTNQENKQLIEEKDVLQNNIDEITKTFNELNIKTSDFEMIKRSVDSFAIVMDINLEGYIISVNNYFYKIYKIPQESIQSTNYIDFIYKSEKTESTDLDKFWKEIKLGQTKRITHKISILGDDYWVADEFIPVKNKNGTVYKIKIISQNITEYKQLEGEVEKASLTIQELDLNNENNNIIIENLKSELKNSNKEVEKLKREETDILLEHQIEHNKVIDELSIKYTNKEAELLSQIEKLNKKLSQK